MSTLLTKSIQVLLDQPRGNGMMVTCYVDTSVSDGFNSHWVQPFKSEASRIRDQLAQDRKAGAEFERNLEEIGRALQSPEARQSRGMAIFSGTGRGFFLAIPAIEPYKNRLVVDEEPYTVPLLEAYFRQREYLLVMTDTHRARWYTAGTGGLRRLGELDEPGPKTERSSSKRGSKQHDTIERHRRDHILHFQKEVAERLEKAWDEHSYQGLVLLGLHELLAQLRTLLPARLTSRVVHELPHPWTEGEHELDEKIRALVATDQVDEESRVSAELDRRLHEATAVAAGPQEVIDALRNGQVRELIMGPETGDSAASCTGCRALFAASFSTCPFCGACCRTANLWQEVLAFAVHHGILVHQVRPSGALTNHGGIAALLARDEPQWEPAATANEPKEIAQ